MLNSEFRFPLFDSILYGPMNPFSTSNSSEAFMLDEKPHLGVEREDDRGVFVLSFLKPFNQKCSFYHQRLMRETVLYCNDLRAELSTLTDPDIRAYRRLTLLDQHLKTALIKTGEVLRENHFTTSGLMSPSTDTESDTEKLSNCYIFQLLKVCLAKAYLEVQHVLVPSGVKQLNENYLYTAFAGEAPPVTAWLRKRKIDELESIPHKPKPVEKKSRVVSDEKSVGVSEKLLTLREIEQLGYGSARTLRRWLDSGKLKGFKIGNIWKVEESELNRYKVELKTKTNHK